MPCNIKIPSLGLIYQLVTENHCTVHEGRSVHMLNVFSLKLFCLFLKKCSMLWRRRIAACIEAPSLALPHSRGHSADLVNSSHRVCLRSSQMNVILLCRRAASACEPSLIKQAKKPDEPAHYPVLLERMLLSISWCLISICRQDVSIQLICVCVCVRVMSLL